MNDAFQPFEDRSHMLLVIYLVYPMPCSADRHAEAKAGAVDQPVTYFHDFPSSAASRMQLH